MTGECKVRGCTEPVVGHSITGKGKCCERHNVMEWANALMASRDPYYRCMGQGLLRDARRKATA